MTSPRTRWSLADLVDFELYLTEDERSRNQPPEREAVERRDRSIYREIEASEAAGGGTVPAGPDGKPHRRWLFHRWLAIRRRESPDPETSPGVLFTSALAVVSCLMGLLGFLFGKGAVLVGFAGGKLAAGRDEPVNILFVLLACILPQAVFALAGAFLLVARRMPKFATPPPVFRVIFAALVRPLFQWLLVRLWEPVAREKKSRVAAAAGIVRGRAAAHTEALWWPLAGILQWFALGYAVAVVSGILIATQIWHETFAWQTAVQAYRPETIHAFVRAVAAPWSWLYGEGIGYPTLEQVRASQFFRYQDPAHLSPGAMSAWWPFLVLAAVGYGLIPRLALFCWVRYQQKAALRRERFADLRSDRLQERMTAPAADWQTAGEEDGPPAAPVSPGASAGGEGVSSAANGCVAMIPSDLDAPAVREALGLALQSWKQWEICETLVLDGSVGNRRESLSRLSKMDENSKVILLQMGHMPPTRELLELLAQIRLAIGRHGALLLGLVGKPVGRTGEEGLQKPFGGPVKAHDLEIWTRRTEALGDPNFDLRPLGDLDFAPLPPSSPSS